ncbi:alpha-glucosidase [Polaribacter sp. HL-MS24]|uniref:glycoside hydrolase family 13 protein n=1 Tax=Polaribacter sp. HL-MS24 TaxID=3077735 RepID=UPI002934CCAC|nr:alpha-glucosidase [Polaribacter sp. HL-MS24]WOC40537.1 alpha-glucosidase [Polaribacter sp. HL-MS24]
MKESNHTDAQLGLEKDARAWWKEGVLYQIYPQSFKDTNGDGYGDFKGVIEKLDYLESLGITMVWMNPFFGSPLVDNGYDVSDYTSIHPRYGTMEDFDAMLEGLHSRGIKFVLDVVVNHSSIEHEWFQQSRSSRENAYRDYYHWWPAENGTPPFRDSIFDPEGAWQFDQKTNAYYLHYFAKEQPDLNWENPIVRAEIYEIMKFWARKGVDGFRMDAFQYASKDTTFPEWPKGHEKEYDKWYGMRPQLHDYLKEMYKEVIEPYQLFAVAEGSGTTFQDAHDLVDAERNELQVAYHFDCRDIVKDAANYQLSDFKAVFSKWDDAFKDKGWLAIYLSNHDVSRLVSRYGNSTSAFRTPSTQMLNTFLLSMRGTPYTYYGDELGMTNIDMPTIEEYVDVSAIGDYHRAKAAGEDMVEFMKKLNFNSRENGRTPMQWDSTENAGFSSGTPWKKVNENYLEINVEAQDKDPNSILNHFRKMVQLRKDNPVLVYGDYQILEAAHPEIYAYTRTLKDKQLLVLLNFSDIKSTIVLPQAVAIGKLLINNYDIFDIEEMTITLLAYQATICELNTLTNTN